MNLLRLISLVCSVGCIALLLLLTPAAPLSADVQDFSPWLPIPHRGFNGTVHAIAVIGDDVYVGGTFTATNDGQVTDLNLIARFDNGTWEPLPNLGLQGEGVYRLAVMGNDLYVGGVFSSTKDGAVQGLHNIAKFSNGQWSALPNQGLNSRVSALTVVGNDLYVGGNFRKTYDNAVDLKAIARFSNGAWTALPDEGLAGQVFAIQPFKGDVYVGGEFSGTRNGRVLASDFIKLAEGKHWESVPGGGLAGPVWALEAMQGRLVLGGSFDQTKDQQTKDLHAVAFFDGDTYHPFANKGLNHGVRSLKFTDGVLYVGGQFDGTADKEIGKMAGVAKYANGQWSRMPNNGLCCGTVLALVRRGGTLLIGGFFGQTLDTMVEDLWHFADFDLGANMTVKQTLKKGTTPIEFIATITAKNLGPNPAFQVKMVDEFPKGYDAVNFTTDKGTCDKKRDKVACDIPSLANDEKATITLTLRSDGTNRPEINCAKVTSATYDPNNANKTACVRIPPQ